MKINFAFFCLFLVNALFAQAELKVSSLLITDESKNMKSANYLCLGEWREFNSELHQEIDILKRDFPHLFADFSSDAKNCFSPVQVPELVKENFDHVLSRIESSNLDKKFETSSVKIKDPTLLRNQNASFGKKLLRGELLVGGVEAAGMGILVAMPRSITKWDDDFFKDATRNLKRAWTKPPVIDKDHWSINYIGHPYAGAIYYNSLRSQGATKFQSFLFSALQSTFWEYTIEAVAEQPSIQDLIATPIVGSFIGELSHIATMKMGKNGFSVPEKILVILINPTYVVNNGFKKKKVFNLY